MYKIKDLIMISNINESFPCPGTVLSLYNVVIYLVFETGL